MLLIIDMQEAFRTKESEQILPNILKLKKKFAPKVVFSKFVNKKGSLFEKQLNWTLFQKKEEQKLFSELQSPNSIELEHNGYTVLNSKLKKYIKENEIEKIYLAGVYTDVCIIKTAMDLFDAGIETFVIKNACASLHWKQNHSLAIDSLKHILWKEHIINIQFIKKNELKK